MSRPRAWTWIRCGTARKGDAHHGSERHESPSTAKPRTMAGSRQSQATTPLRRQAGGLTESLRPARPLLEGYCGPGGQVDDLDVSIEVVAPPPVAAAVRSAIDASHHARRCGFLPSICHLLLGNQTERAGTWW